MPDPNRVGLDAAGHDNFQSLQVLTPEVCFPEAPGWPGSYYHSPWPLSEDIFLVAFSFDPLPGMGPKVSRDTETGLYLFDRSDPKACHAVKARYRYFSRLICEGGEMLSSPFN